MHSEFMKSADGFLKKTKKAVTKMMPANKSVVDNKNNPASASAMTQRMHKKAAQRP